jgi:hypothetical protein
MLQRRLMLPSTQLLRLLLVAVGLSYIVSLVLRRLRGVRNEDPNIARLESWQVIGLIIGVVSFGLLWLSMLMHAPILVIYVLIGSLVGGMLLFVRAYLLAWRS